MSTLTECNTQVSDNYWSAGGSIITSCNNSCQISPGNKIALIYNKPDSYIQVSIPIPSNLPNVYNQFGVDALAFVKTQTSLQIQINNSTPQTFSPLQQTVYSENYSFKCGSPTNYFYKLSSSIISSSITSQLTVLIIKQTNGVETGVKYLRIWASCAQNCSTCASTDNCTQCFDGLQLFIFPETGKGACETNSNCNISNCFSCAISSTRKVCLKCYAGYTLDSNYNCIANTGGSCLAGQYINTSGACENYTTNCYYQNSSGSYTSCSNEEDVTKYKCKSNQYIFILNYFNYQVARCGCQDPNCSTCILSSSICNNCITGYQKNILSGLCEKICPTSGTYYDTSTSSCKNCSDPNCVSCTSTQCLACKTSYILDQTTSLCVYSCLSSQYWDSSTFSCQNCPNGCQSCLASNTCTQCQSNLVWDSSSSQCKPCTSPQVYDTITSSCITCQSNCNLCNSNQCTSCTDNTYQIDSNNIHQCIKIPLNCASNQYYNPINYVCINCSINCLTCNSTTCLTCLDNTYQLDINDSKQCVRIPLNCSTNQYYDSISYLCVNCQMNCLTCNSTTCLTCLDNTYQLDSNNVQKCIRIPLNCASNQYYDSLNYLCINCSTNCLTCNSTTCLSCLDNTYQLDTNDSKQCVRIPLNCSTNQYYDSIGYLCINCQMNCSTCNSTTCLTCLDNTYQLDSNNQQQCVRIPLNCASNQYYDSINYLCINCSTNCLTCNSTTCLTCLDNTYSVDSNNIKQCVRIPLNCANNQYYDSVNYVCVNCSINCLACNSTNCQSCINNTYEIDPNNTKACIKIPISCQSNEYYDSQSNSCIQCGQNCSTCTINGCLSCINQTFIVDNQNQNNCIQRTCTQNCSLCDNQTCLQCINVNYIVDQNSQLNCIQLPCAVPNCKICQTNQINQCSFCQAGYQINGNYQCQIQCTSSNCSECVANSATDCKTCIKYFQLNSTTNQCDVICQMSFCQQCYPNNPFQCKTCQSGYSMDLQNNFCYTQSQSKTKFTISQYKKSNQDNYYIFEIKFGKDLVSKLSTYQNQNIISFEIMGRNDFTYTISEQSSNIIALEMIIENEIKNQQCTITFKSKQFLYENQLESDSQTLDVLPYVKISEGNKKASQSVSNVANGVTTSITSSFIPIVIVSNFYVLVNTIDITGFYYYLLFIDVRLPENVTSFFAIFQNFQFPFIPNMFQNLIDSSYIQYSPKPFKKNGNQGYFITNGGQSLTICSCIISLYLLARLGILIPIRSINQYFRRAVAQTWHFSAFFDMFCTVYIYVIFAVFLQFYEFSYEDRIAPLNYFLFSCCAIIFISLPFFIIFKLYKNKQIKSDPTFQQKYFALLSGLHLFNEVEADQTQNQDASFISKRRKRNSFKQDLKVAEESKPVSSPSLTARQNAFLESLNINQITNQTHSYLSQEIKSQRERNQIKFSKYFVGICYLRKLIFALIVTYMNEYPYAQLSLVSLLNIFKIGYVIYIKPYTKNYENIKYIAGECSLIIVQSCVIYLVKDEEGQNEDDRYTVGWAIIAVCGFIILWNTLQLILELFISLIRSLIQIICRKNYSIKVQEIDKDLNQQEDNQQMHIGDLNETNTGRIKSPNSQCSTADLFRKNLPQLQIDNQHQLVPQLDKYLQLSTKCSPLSVQSSEIQPIYKNEDVRKQNEKTLNSNRLYQLMFLPSTPSQSRRKRKSSNQSNFVLQSNQDSINQSNSPQIKQQALQIRQKLAQTEQSPQLNYSSQLNDIIYKDDFQLK